ncbi:hypothetical protein V641_00793 [Staphylococcus aureus T83543]|nr:hypothetical protein V641_00793 [Staphylococcus aureus T83543]
MKMRLQQAFFNSSQGPQHREFRKEILQAMRVGVWAPTQKLTKSQLTIMCKLAGPQHREFRKEILQAMRVGVWAPTQRISKRNSTGNASWGVGPNIEKLDSQFLQTMQVGGAPTQKLTKSQLTIMCKLAGPQHRSWRKVSLQ